MRIYGKGVFSEKSILGDSREPPDSGKQRRARSLSRDSREFAKLKKF